MAVLFSGLVSGRTSASVDGTATGIIATKAISLNDDGLLRYTDVTGFVRMVKVSGDVAQLLKEIFTGTGGITHAVLV